ncbi:MAG TPA: hypothetical protein VLS89_10435, partial [Candidatus Nanopelagicales bacterium]|nr:hypothetical protein [Candidatus Nanopelagicales bacterium]
DPPSPPPVAAAKSPASPAPIQRPVTPRPVVAATPKPPQATPSRPAVPPADPCNGDLLCAMQRAVKK